MTHERSLWDVAVIGAGPAGALSALLAARRGLRTLLVEKRVMPRSKVCGCCLAPGGQSVLRAAGLGALMGQGVALDRLQVVQDGVTCSVPTPRYRTLDRSVMDVAIVDAARRAGAAFRQGQAWRISRVASEHVEVVDEEGAFESARAVVVADGIGGGSARDVPGMAWDVRRSSRVGLGATIERWPEGADPSAITMVVGRDGYVGIARLPGGGAAIAAAINPTSIADDGPSHVVERLLASGGVALGEPSALRLRGTPPLTRRRRSVEAQGRVFAIGDATGYVEPFTGEGMTWALRAADRVATSLEDVARDRYRSGAWTAIVRAEARSQTRSCRLVTWGLRHPGVTGAVVRAGSVWPALAAALARSLAPRDVSLGAPA